MVTGAVGAGEVVVTVTPEPDCVVCKLVVVPIVPVVVTGAVCVVVVEAVDVVVLEPPQATAESRKPIRMKKIMTFDMIVPLLKTPIPSYEYILTASKNGFGVAIVDCIPRSFQTDIPPEDQVCILIWR
jgi:hypothetical protein